MTNLSGFAARSRPGGRWGWLVGVLLAVLVSLVPLAPVSAQSDPNAKYGSNLRVILSQPLSDQVGRPGVLNDNTLSLIITARADVTNQLRSLGVTVRSVLNNGTLITADVPITVLSKVAEIPDVISIDAPVQTNPTSPSTGVSFDVAAPAPPPPAPAPAPAASAPAPARVIRPVHAIGRADFTSSSVTVVSPNGERRTYQLTASTDFVRAPGDVTTASGRMVIVVGREVDGVLVARRVIFRGGE